LYIRPTKSGFFNSSFGGRGRRPAPVNNSSFTNKIEQIQTEKKKEEEERNG